MKVRSIMAKIKKQEREIQLTERQFNYVKLLNIALNYNELKNRIISGYFYEICIINGYPEDQNLAFEIDLDANDMILKVKEIPKEAIDPQA